MKNYLPHFTKALTIVGSLSSGFAEAAPAAPTQESTQLALNSVDINQSRMNRLWNNTQIGFLGFLNGEPANTGLYDLACPDAFAESVENIASSFYAAAPKGTISFDTSAFLYDRRTENYEPTAIAEHNLGAQFYYDKASLTRIIERVLMQSNRDLVRRMHNETTLDAPEFDPECGFLFSSAPGFPDMGGPS